MSALLTHPAFHICRGRSPLIWTAIHQGHEVRASLLPHFQLSEEERLREEDPFTAGWAELGDTYVIGQRSRFEVDLNRPPDKAVYRGPEDAWGLNVWKNPLPEQEYEHSLLIYATFYEHLRVLLDETVRRYGSFIVYDIHSYNHRRSGPDQPPAPARENPEVNVGTGNLNRRLWAPVVDSFIQSMRNWDFMGRSLDVRENVKFTGGYFSEWIHTRYGDSSCVMAIEFKKIFMDEWTGRPYPEMIEHIKDALQSTVPVVMEAYGQVQLRREDEERPDRASMSS